MSEPFLSEIRMTAFNFPPKGWALCNGQLLPINQNRALFALLGTTFGGNGQTTFALPDLRGRIPMHAGNNHTLGERGGMETVTVDIQQMPQHTHVAQAAAIAATGDDPGTGVVLAEPAFDLYAAAGNLVAMGAQSITSVGGLQPHNNCQPFLVVSFIIALQGIFPSQN